MDEDGKKGWYVKLDSSVKTMEWTDIPLAILGSF